MSSVYGVEALIWLLIALLRIAWLLIALIRLLIALIGLLLPRRHVWLIGLLVDLLSCDGLLAGDEREAWDGRSAGLSGILLLAGVRHLLLAWIGLLNWILAHRINAILAGLRIVSSSVGIRILRLPRLRILIAAVGVEVAGQLLAVASGCTGWGHLSGSALYIALT